FDDIKKLLRVLDRLVEGGNTAVVIEHNLDVIKTADHVIDIGPDGGDAGGRIVATGTPEEVAAVPASYTGRFLADLLPKASTRRAASHRGGDAAASARQLAPVREPSRALPQRLSGLHQGLLR